MIVEVPVVDVDENFLNGVCQWLLTLNQLTHFHGLKARDLTNSRPSGARIEGYEPPARSMSPILVITITIRIETIDVMAEPISLASGLLALAGFAFQASITLYQTVQSFKFHPKQLRDLKEELEALSGVLGSLTETVSATTDVDLSALDLPLLRCGNACKEFGQEIMSCNYWLDTSLLLSSRSQTQICKPMCILLNGVVLNFSSRKSSTSAESLGIYQDLLKSATDDLEAHLQNIDEKLETKFSRTVAEDPADLAELRLIREERMSAQKCLQICAQLSDHIDQIQLGHEEPPTLPERFTIVGLQECKNSLSIMTATLEGYMKSRIHQLVTKSKTALISEEDLADLLRLQEETRQVGGYLSDLSVQQLSRDMSSIRLEHGGNEGSPSGNTMPVPNDGVEGTKNSEFKKRWGPGLRLTPKSTADISIPSELSAAGKLSGTPK
ncbi:hypothetical protein BKA65DRAFT_488158 [Rhexocercosporidium sp. MPI-PUGE-AT-0058]|nr:hypothetical protein BKA65DRAFT_488158 [Rhexocercosporidium sp. MPI-PUGE-AT-0058]